MPDTPGSTVPNPGLLTVYVNDHIAAATGGIELVSRMIGVHRGDRHEGPLRQLLDELREEKEGLTAIAGSLGLPVRQYKQAAVWVAEKVSRGKFNGHLLSRSPLSGLVEFEFLTSAVRAKRSGLETLRMSAEVDPRIDAALLDRLIDQANRQFEWLTEVRRQVAAELFGGSPEVVEGSADSSS